MRKTNTTGLLASDSNNVEDKTLAQRAAKGAGVMGLGQLIRIVIQLGSVVVLARLLDASSFGLIAMVTAVIGIAEVVRDFGLAPAAIQAKTLSRGQRSNLFWVNLGIGSFLALVVVLLSGIVALVYDDERVQPIMMCLAPVFIINAVATQYRAGLSRELKFKALAFSEVLAQLVGLVAAVVLALLGAGYWAIVAQQLAQAAVLCICVVIASGWLPGLYNRSAPISGFLRYGSNLLGTQLLVYLSSNIDTFLIGSRFGATTLGLYNRAFQMIVLPLNQINSPATRVALPVLSRLQEKSSDFDRYLLRGQLCLSWLVVPIFAFVAANSGASVRLLLGDGWSEVGPIFAILAIGGMFQTLSYSTYWVFLARGLTRSNLKFAMTTRIAMIIIIAVGALHSVSAVAIGYTLSVGLIWFLGLIWIRKAAKAPAGRMFGEGMLILGASSISASAARLCASAAGYDGFLGQLLFPGAVFAVLMALIIAVLPATRRSFLEILSVGVLIKSKRLV